LVSYLWCSDGDYTSRTAPSPGDTDIYMKEGRQKTRMTEKSEKKNVKDK
jgi:hypothetical protein